MSAANFWVEVLTSPTILITAFVIGAFGEVCKRAIKAKEGDRGWRGVYYVTLPAHAVIVGILLGFVPFLPAAGALEKEGYELASRIGTYACAGVICKVAYDVLVSTLRRAIAMRVSGGDGGSSGDSGNAPADPS